MLKIWFTDQRTARKPALQPVIILWGTGKESGSVIYIILFPMNNCKDSVGSLGRINRNKRSAALNTVLPEPCWPTLKVYSPFPLWCVSHVEKRFWQGEHPERKVHKWSAPLGPLKAGLNRLKPGLKFHCPEHWALDRVRRSGLRQTPRDLRQVPGDRWGPSKIQPQINHCLHHVFQL